MRHIIKYLSLMLMIGGMPSCVQRSEEDPLREGLIGAYYGDADFTNIKYPEILFGLDNFWDESTGHGSAWSGRYEGVLISPVSGKVTLYLETNKEASLRIEDQTLSADAEQTSDEVTLAFRKEKRYPLSIAYAHLEGAPGELKISWSWKGQEKTSIPASAVGFTNEQALTWNYLPEPDPASINYSEFLRANGKQVIVFSEPGRFGGWPANGGIWNWGDEILVAFTNAAYKENLLHHSVDETKPSLAALARSKDGGETWTYEYPDHYPADGRKLLPPNNRVNFAHPDLAMKVSGKHYYVSYDRGRSWEGPYKIPMFGRKKLTSRTDYQVINEDSCLFFLSTEEEDLVQARLQDWAFCALTGDGGRNFTFLSWLNEPVEVRSVMPSTVRTGEKSLVTALRRRYDQTFGDSLPKLSRTWIDAFASHDNGKTWQCLGKVAETDMGKHNGNPPSLCKLRDGRLCLTYAYRAVPYGIRAKISKDNGHTWGEEIHLRDGAREFDMGYTRTVQRSDGKIVTVYYFTTEERKEQYIEATIWDPDDLIRPEKL
jgi:hypothetical protein